MGRWKSYNGLLIFWWICFDTTYKTDQCGRPLGIFDGIDNHGRTIIFGIALLFDEAIPSFNWLFFTFVPIIGKEPKTILIDRDKAMAAAMECVLPNTCHRIYIWHMYQNACLSPRSCVLPNYRWAETI